MKSELQLILEQIASVLNESKTIDRLLDKINSVGLDKLTDFEKDILSNATEFSNIEDDTTKFLNKSYRNLEIIDHTVINKITKINNQSIRFFDKEDKLVFEFDKNRKIMSLNYEKLTRNLGQHYNEKVLIDWFKNNYQIEIKSISNFFKYIK